MTLILAKAKDWKGFLPKIAKSRMHNARPKPTPVSDDNEDLLKDALDKMQRRVEDIVTAASANDAPTYVDIGSPSPADAASIGDPDTPKELSKEALTRATRLAQLMAMFAHVTDDDKVQPPVLSEEGKILLAVTTQREGVRAYSDAAIALANKMARPENTHILGRLVTLAPNGYTDYMAACWLANHYRASPLAPSARPSSTRRAPALSST